MKEPERIVGEVTINGKDYLIHEDTDPQILLDIIEHLLEHCDALKEKHDHDIMTLFGMAQEAVH